MPKALRLASSMPASYVPSRSDSSKSDSQKSDTNQFIPIALFSGIGLLVSIVAILCGVQGAWY